ncbi:hypothetical protein Bca52824_020765 [Brassica carinata]|uniref:Uncharacterized protein n=1 Tax=Brassica carinata TaxID=52824 RepID=A0A8X7VT57_BRACI|nr:hypothetical protein Bca52824_020765 [Brassica carinata]
MYESQKPDPSCNLLPSKHDTTKVKHKTHGGRCLKLVANYQPSLSIDWSGEGDAVLQRLEDTIAVAKAENTVKEIRDVRMVIAQIQFLQKNIDEASKTYEQLKKAEATVQFAK